MGIKEKIANKVRNQLADFLLKKSVPLLSNYALLKYFVKFNYSFLLDNENRCTLVHDGPLLHYLNTRKRKTFGIDKETIRITCGVSITVNTKGFEIVNILGHKCMMTQSIEIKNEHNVKNEYKILKMEIFCPKQYVKDFNNKLDNEIQAMYYTNTERDHIYIDDTQRKKRSLNSIACSSNIKEYLLNDIHNFIKSENAYVQRGINYKRNYLLYGPPGTGKTSLIFSLASELDRDIKLIDGSTICNIDSFRKTLINTPIRTIIVIEDIDALSKQLFNRDDKYPVTVDKSSTTLSDILNYFDGLHTPQGLICFFTTNYIDRLDSAFVRDGRMDVKIKIEHAEKADVIDGMIRHFVGEHELIKIEKSMPTGRYDTSKLQSFLMNYYNKTLEGNNNEVLKELIKNIKKCNLK